MNVDEEMKGLSPKQVTIKDVAKRAGVSVASVSRALNGLGGISEETRAYVLRICEEMAYVPNSLARGLVMREAQTLGIVVPDITSPFYAELMVFAADEAKQYGYQVLLCNSFRDYETETNYFKLLIGNQVEGILFFPVGDLSAGNLYQFMRYVPIISLNEMPEGSPIPYVCADEESCGRLAAEYLIQNGCRSLMMVGVKEERLAHRYRKTGFLKAAEERGVEVRVFESGNSYKNSFERGYGEFLEFLKENKKLPDGVAGVSDATANGVIKACMERKIRIPEELALVGIDNINADLPAMELTTVAISHRLHVQKALELMLQMKERSLSRQERRLHLEPRLIERASGRR